MVLMYLTVVYGCAGRDDSGSSSPGITRKSGNQLYAVQIGAFSDSSVARRLADSLTMAGWQAFVSRDTGSTHRVRVSPSQSDALTQRVAQALRNQGVDALAVLDTIQLDPFAEALVVNRGPHGMSARVRWLVAPNGRALLVVHDPSGVEGEALPDGFLYVSERDGVVVQRDSVWDVAPSQSWNSIAYGQAFIMRTPEYGVFPDSAADTTDVWQQAASAANVSVDTLRAHSFLISGMAEVYSYARPVIVQLNAIDSTTGAVAPRSEFLPAHGGWRVRWAPDTNILAIGDAPIRVQDDSPPRNWLVLDAKLGDVKGSVSQSRLVPLDWRLGPALDVSVAIDDKSPRTFRLEGATITSGGGWIKRDGKLVGPGVPLAGTRDGRFIAALAPKVNPKEYESPLEPVVYRVNR